MMKSIGKKVGALAGGMVLVGSLAACGDDGAAGTDDAGGKGDEVVYVGASATPGNAQVILYAVPKVLGFFDEENINVTYQTANGSTAALQAVASGSGDVTNPDAGEIPAAVSKGVPVKGVAGIVQQWPYQVVTKADSPIKSMKDLDGKALGIVSLASGSKPYAEAVLGDAGLEPEKDTKLLPVGAHGPGPITALNNGQVQALALYHEVYATIENQGTKLNYLPNPASFDKIIGGTYVAKPSALEGEDPAVIRFIRASFKGVLAAAENPEMAVRAGWEVFPETKPTGVDEATALKQKVKVLQASSTFYALDGKIPVADPSYKFGNVTDDQWKATQEFAIKAGKITEALPVDKIWDGRFIDAINDFDRDEVIAKAKAGS